MKRIAIMAALGVLLGGSAFAHRLPDPPLVGQRLDGFEQVFGDFLGGRRNEFRDGRHGIPLSILDCRSWEASGVNPSVHLSNVPTG